MVKLALESELLLSYTLSKIVQNDKFNPFYQKYNISGLSGKSKIILLLPNINRPTRSQIDPSKSLTIDITMSCNVISNWEKLANLAVTSTSVRF